MSVLYFSGCQMVCKDIAAAVQAIHEPPQQVMQTPSADHDFDSIWDVSAEINTDPVSDSVLYSTVLSTAVISKPPADDQQTSIVEVPDVSCQSTFPPLTSSTPTSTRPASTRPAPTPATPRPTPASTRLHPHLQLLDLLLHLLDLHPHLQLLDLLLHLLDLHLHLHGVRRMFIQNLI